MKARQATTAFLVLAVLGCGLAFAAGGTDATKLPGYVDLGAVKIPAGAEIAQEIDLGPDLIKAAFGGGKGTVDNELAQALSMVKSVHLLSLSVPSGGAAALRDQVDALQKKLAAKSWQRIVFSREDDEYVVISVLHGGDSIQGLMVMSVENDEATFANVAGEMDLGTLMAIAGER